MQRDLNHFLGYYNLQRRHGILRKELNVKTPYNTLEKWYQIKPEIFRFSKKIVIFESMFNFLL